MLYVAGSRDLLARLIEVVQCPTFPVCVTGSAVLKQQGIEANVGFMAGGVRRFSTLRQSLAALKHPV